MRLNSTPKRRILFHADLRVGLGADIGGNVSAEAVQQRLQKVQLLSATDAVSLANVTGVGMVYRALDNLSEKLQRFVGQTPNSSVFAFISKTRLKPRVDDVVPIEVSQSDKVLVGMANAELNSAIGRVNLKKRFQRGSGTHSHITHPNLRSLGFEFSEPAAHDHRQQS